MIDLVAALIILAVNLENECSDRDCGQTEQVAVTRVVLHRAGTIDYDSVKGVLFADRQFSGFNTTVSRAEAELVVKAYRRSGVWPERYKRYRGVVLSAAVQGGGEYNHYRRCDMFDTASWSSEEWYTGTGWHHCFAKPEHVSRTGGRVEEALKVERAVKNARRRAMKKFWKIKISREDRGC